MEDSIPPTGSSPAIRVDVRGGGLDDHVAIRAHAARRIQFALGRLWRGLQSVHVRVERQTARSHPHAVRCSIHVRANGGSPVDVEGADSSAIGAIDNAAERASAALRREMRRREDVQRLAKELMVSGPTELPGRAATPRRSGRYATLR